MIVIIGKRDRLLFTEINDRLEALAKSINIDVETRAAAISSKDVKVNVYGSGIYNAEEISENTLDKALAEELGDLDDYNAISKNPTFFEEDRFSLGRLDEMTE